VRKKGKLKIELPFFSFVKRTGAAVTENFSLKLKEKEVPDSGSIFI